LVFPTKYDREVAIILDPGSSYCYVDRRLNHFVVALNLTSPTGILSYYKAVGFNLDITGTTSTLHFYKHGINFDHQLFT
jgi:hypothetical protein